MLLYVFVNHSEVTQELTCKGHWRDKGDADVMHAQFTEYRWWILWAESDGYLKVRTEKLALMGFFRCGQARGPLDPMNGKH